ncbi:MAG: MarR family transcriptional regulator [Candidatus Rokubacteria bacterium]|nr:MarR family transcriptional regulator [Candidatus Rokubacteria bacterium]
MKDATLTRQARELQDALGEFIRVYQFRDRDRICCHDVSVTQCYALDVLLRRGLATLNELATELCLDKSTASRVVATLERKGYVARSTHPRDRRAVLLTATATGKRLVERILGGLVEEKKQILAEFPEDVRELAAELIQRLTTASRGRTMCATPVGKVASTN